MVGGTKDAFDRFARQHNDLDEVITRNSVFTTTVNHEDEIVSYTYVHNELESSYMTTTTPSGEGGEVPVEKKVLNVNASEYHSLFDALIQENDRVHQEKVTAAAAAAHTAQQFGDDATYGRMVIPDRGMKMDLSMQAANKIGYKPFSMNKRSDQEAQGWELRIHIEPEAIDVDNPHNKFDIIQACVERIWSNENASCKIYQYHEDEESYDGALWASGKDRTQFGKEVCIYLPNANIAQLKPAQYKQKLLELWRLLQDNDVPLFQFIPPGDQAILVQGSDVPTPFSFTSNNPREPGQEEWTGRHGILHKTFQSHGKHPILDVSLSVEDLSSQSIALSTSLTRSAKILQQHDKNVHSYIVSQLRAIQQQDWSYSDLFYGTPTLEDELKALVKVYNEGFDQCGSVEERGAFQGAFANEILQHKSYQRFITHFPHQADSQFNVDGRINRIPAGIEQGDLEEQEIDELVRGLRLEFDIVRGEFTGQALIDLSEELKAYGGSIPAEFNITELICKNPVAMQKIYRQLALISQEIDQNKIMDNENSLVVNLLEAYKSEREAKTSNEYFGYFSVFSLFTGYSKKQKFVAVDALISSIKNPDIPLDTKFLGPLGQGNLLKYIQSLGLNLAEFTNKVMPEDKVERWFRS